MKCVYKVCELDAEYILGGFSFCSGHNNGKDYLDTSLKLMRSRVIVSEGVTQAIGLVLFRQQKDFDFVLAEERRVR